MRIPVPPKRIRERFLIIYEREGCQRAVNYLTEYYGVRKMKVILDGKRVGRRKSNGWIASYRKGKAFFTKQGFKRRLVLHEFYHHLVAMKGLEMTLGEEEKNARSYSRDFTT